MTRIAVALGAVLMVAAAFAAAEPNAVISFLVVLGHRAAYGN